MNKTVQSAILLVATSLTVPLWASAEDIFEVRAIAMDSTFYRMGKIVKEKPGDEVVYRVDVPNKTVTRTSVYNKDLPRDLGGGLQSDNTTYAIMHDGFFDGRRVIKAFGKTGSLDGYEILVIGEDFVTTSRSSAEHFALYSYKRTDDLPEEFRIQKKN